ncbi:hypothetical protein YC2023_017405 [Brassica napus]|uniref:(rape) hypothetical protein n=1 Tax=Brassica napus TaxID=3708 RepID=A0A816KD16_BRANA|nr:unnamed protein product [Brassica napus]
MSSFFTVLFQNYKRRMKPARSQPSTPRDKRRRRSQKPTNDTEGAIVSGRKTRSQNQTHLISNLLIYDLKRSLRSREFSLSNRRERSSLFQSVVNYQYIKT